MFSQELVIDSVSVARDTIIPQQEIIQQTDTIQPISAEVVQELYTDDDLKLIDSLLVEAKFKSPLFDSNNYVINDADIIGNVESIVSSDLLKARLSEINATTPFNLEYNSALEKVVNNYIKYRKKYYPALMARAQYYFPMFEQYLDEYNIPLEMKYLAIVESTLDPRAKSRVGATGLWQFMYGTRKTI